MTAKKNIGMTGMLLSFLLSGCTPAPSLPTPPINLPITLHKAGSKVETTFLVLKSAKYLFALEYLYHSLENTHRNNIHVLADTDDDDGQSLDKGIPVHLRFQLRHIDSEQGAGHIVRDEELSAHPIRSENHVGVTKAINDIELASGYYRVSVETFRDEPRLAKTAVSFKVIEANPKKE